MRVEDERANLLRARDYYSDVDAVEVPAVLDFSTPSVTYMDFVEGGKVTDAFPGDDERRAKLARRVSDALTYDVLFSPKEDALFHGDPHAGNVFHVENAVGDPYRIALLDWGLAAEFSRADRERMVQLMLGLHLKNPKRLRNHAEVLVRDGGEAGAESEEMEALVTRVLAEREGGMFELLDELIAELSREGRTIRFETAMFIKAQLTISGILHELDPDFEQDDYVMSRISGQVFKELHMRLARTVWFPAWNSHAYRSMMSNEDVKDVQFKRMGGAFKAMGKGIWTAVSFQWLL